MRGVGLLASVLLGASIALISLPSKAAVEDEVRLRDGRLLRGRVVERVPGRWIVIETEGRRRTFAWDLVEEIDLAAPANTAEPAPAPATFRPAGGGLTYELRLLVSAVFLPERTFGLTGQCSTGSGVAPASMYGQSAHAGGTALGGGVGVRAGWMYRSRINDHGASSWWGLRIGLGLDVQGFHAHAPIGIRALNGELCSQVAKTRHVVDYETSALLLAQVPFNLGAHLAFGKLDAGRWRGIVLGGAWTPSTVHIAFFGDASGSHFNYLGLELTLDVAVLHATARRRPESHVRVALYLSPAAKESQATLGTLSLGAVWY
jgi:hypothetical protein